MTVKFYLTPVRMAIMKKTHARHQWLMPIILATWEAEIKKIVVPS
jgi:hypothetical protein